MLAQFAADSGFRVSLLFAWRMLSLSSTNLLVFGTAYSAPQLGMRVNIPSTLAETLLGDVRERVENKIPAV